MTQMDTVVTKNHTTQDYKVADLSLAAWGRKKSPLQKQKCRV